MPLPDVHTVPLQPEVLSSHLDAAPATPPEVLSLASIDAANNDGALLTTEEQEKIERVAHNCAQMVADLNDQQAEQREEIKRENEEFNLIKQEVDEAAGKPNCRRKYSSAWVRIDPAKTRTSKASAAS